MVISQEIFEAFLNCPTKSYLLYHTDVASDTTIFWEGERWRVVFTQSDLSKIRVGTEDAEVYVGTPTPEAIRQQRYRFILDCAFQTPRLLAHSTV